MTANTDPQRLDELVELSLELGEPERDLAILAEGNTSARIDDQSFWVKAAPRWPGPRTPTTMWR